MEETQAAPKLVNAPADGPNEPLVLLSPASDGKLGLSLFDW